MRPVFATALLLAVALIIAAFVFVRSNFPKTTWIPSRVNGVEVDQISALAHESSLVAMAGPTPTNTSTSLSVVGFIPQKNGFWLIVGLRPAAKNVIADAAADYQPKSVPRRDAGRHSVRPVFATALLLAVALIIAAFVFVRSNFPKTTWIPSRVNGVEVDQISALAHESSLVAMAGPTPTNTSTSLSVVGFIPQKNGFWLIVGLRTAAKNVIADAAADIGTQLEVLPSEHIQVTALPKREIRLYPRGQFAKGATVRYATIQPLLVDLPGGFDGALIEVFIESRHRWQPREYEVSLNLETFSIHVSGPPIIAEEGRTSMVFRVD